jgi:hypothetical protein
MPLLSYKDSSVLVEHLEYPNLNFAKIYQASTNFEG